MTISLALFPAVTVTVVRDRKIRTALRTNQIAGFVTVPSWKKISSHICPRTFTVPRSEQSFNEQMMSNDKYLRLFSCQMEAIVFIILQLGNITRIYLKSIQSTNRARAKIFD